MSLFRPDTLLAQALGDGEPPPSADPVTGGLIPPIQPSTTFLRDPDNAYRRGFDYTRDRNPTPGHAEAVLAALEGGAQALLFASGMAAATAVFQALRPGDHVVAPQVIYWGLRYWLLNTATAWGLAVDFVDTTDPAAVQAALRPGRTRLLWLETPANPTWAVSDIEALSGLAHAAGAVVAVDNTVPTPLLTRPLELGADLVMHSATKYLNGHSDVLAGALVTRARGRALGPHPRHPPRPGCRPRPVRGLAAAARHADAPSPPAARLRLGHAPRRAPRSTTRGSSASSTQACRPTRATRSPPGRCAAASAACCRSWSGAARRPRSRPPPMCRLWKRATSLGGVESLVEHRASIEGAGSPAPPNLLRLSVGLEDVGDLIADLDRALAASA